MRSTGPSNLVRKSVLTSSDFSPLSIAIAGDRIVVLLIKFSATVPITVEATN
ncbi:hypothetical protein A2U01_0074232, partial [Trifolium medium]|nr:hypothetical protein [Trifolium medium]